MQLHFLSSITKKITCVTVKSSPFFQALIVGLEQLKTGGKHFQEKWCTQFANSSSIKGVDFTRSTDISKTQVFALMDKYINALNEL